MLLDNTKEDDGKKDLMDYFHPKLFEKFKFGKNISLEHNLKFENGGIKEGFSLGGEVPIFDIFSARGKISDKGVRFGVGAGNSNLAYIGPFVGYENGQVMGGIEANVLGCLSAETSAGYSWDEDKITLKASFEAFGQKIDLGKYEIKDVATNTIGRGLDNIKNTFDDIYKHISPEEKAKMRFAEELREDAKNVHDIHGLNDIINKFGENELAIKGNESMFQLAQATKNYLNELDDRVSKNREDIDRHEVLLNIHEERLNMHDKILAEHGQRLDHHDHLLKVHGAILNNHEVRLKRHERILASHDHILRVHGAILNHHERRLNRHETILNIHQNRLNEHDRILSIHGSVLREHEERLNIHAIKINELDQRMFHAEQNIYILGKQVDINSKILANHNEILANHSECIGELYHITQKQQIQLQIHNDIINDHQMEIVKLIYNYNDLRERIEDDEKVIVQLGNEVAKVTNFSVETRNIVDGLAYQTQVHKDLLIQNHNDVVNLYKELENQKIDIIEQSYNLKIVANKVYENSEILYQHRQKIIELQNCVKNIEKEIKNIHEILINFEKRFSQFTKQVDAIIDNKIKLKEIKDEMKKRTNNLNKKVEKFNEQQKTDFIKCSYIAIATGNFNFEHLEKVVNNIFNL